MSLARHVRASVARRVERSAEVHLRMREIISGGVSRGCARTRAGGSVRALSVQAGRSGMSETVFGPWWLGAAGARLSVEVDEHVLALVQMGEIL